MALRIPRPGGATVRLLAWAINLAPLVWPAAVAARPPARAPFVIAGQSVPAGQRMHLDVPVAAGPTDPATTIPVTVFHGAHPGQVVAITTGVHGFEFAPILAAQALLDRIDAGTLRGTVVLVRLAHVAAFEQRVPYVNPYDRKNLNRSFPGRADGTQTERIAWALSTEVIARCDVHIEVHSGDGAEWLEAFAGVYGGPLAAREDLARRVGLAFGFQNVIRYAMHTQAQVDTGRSLNRQAVAAGKPTVLIEIGENGRRDEAWVDAIVQGVENVLRTLEMQPGQPAAARSDTRWYAGTVSVNATATGIVTPVATRGRPVRTGDPIATMRDYTGRVVEHVVSPVDGYVMYGLAGPPVRAGESVVTIAIPAQDEDGG
jgi:predicted deacylase